MIIFCINLCTLFCIALCNVLIFESLKHFEIHSDIGYTVNTPPDDLISDQLNAEWLAENTARFQQLAARELSSATAVQL